MTNPRHVAIIGAGLGGLRTAEQLRTVGFDGVITLVGVERHPPYDRPPLSKQVLTGEWAPERAVLRDADGLAELGVRTVTGLRAVALRGNTVYFADRTQLRADALVIATGARARRFPKQPSGVHSLRTLEQAMTLRRALADAGSLLVLGGGFIGAEVATAARMRGVRVTVLESMPVPCARALGPAVGGLAARLMTEHGVDLRLDAKVTRFVDSHTVELANGERVGADVVLSAVGACPAVDWLHNDQVDTRGGLACDASGRVYGLPGVWAVGDVAAWADPVRGGHFRQEHWTAATDQAAAVARDIVGAEPPPPALPYFWSDQFGLKIQGLGRPDLGDTMAPLSGDGLDGGAIKGTTAGYFTGGKLVGVVGFGAAKWVARCRPLLTRGASRAEALALT
ncbi:NAD(P)/FAD-dependent oxidoreductase [Amycolatopsis thermoflava]|uniref:NAD(P)/FAD-dependent oxidoreductase n=1 Tax=Amycolatopsis thermoflava TaxID=84480 RepID=UPI0037FAA63A